MWICSFANLSEERKLILKIRWTKSKARERKNNQRKKKMSDVYDCDDIGDYYDDDNMYASDGYDEGMEEVVNVSEVISRTGSGTAAHTIVAPKLKSSGDNCGGL